MFSSLPSSQMEWLLPRDSPPNSGCNLNHFKLSSALSFQNQHWRVVQVVGLLKTHVNQRCKCTTLPFYPNNLPRYFHLGGTVSSFSLCHCRASDTGWPSQNCCTCLELQSHWSASCFQNPPAATGSDHCLMETNLLHLFWNRRERFRPQPMALKQTHVKVLVNGRQPSWEEFNTKKPWRHAREIWLCFFFKRHL